MYHAEQAVKLLNYILGFFIARTILIGDCLLRRFSCPRGTHHLFDSAKRQSLFPTPYNHLKNVKQMMNELQIFSNPTFGEIRTQMSASGEPLFCLVDVAKALGYARPADAVSAHCKGVFILPTPTNGGVQQIKFGKEGELYRLILKSNTPMAESFQTWVCDEVLPSIRKQGGYMVAKADESAEEVMARVLLIAQQTLQRRDERIKALESETTQQQQLLLAQGNQITDLQEEISEMLPKVSYYDQILQSKSTVCTTQIAQDYGMSAKKFNIELRNLHIQRKVNGQWILYAPYNKMGYVHSETFIPENSTTGKVISLTKWTQRGLCSYTTN